MIPSLDLLNIISLLAYGGVQFCSGYIYPGNSAYGIFVAIAVPLNLPHRNVFVSYNFEANYNLPGDAQTIIPGPYKRFDSDEETVGEETVDEGTVDEEIEVTNAGETERGLTHKQTSDQIDHISKAFSNKHNLKLKPLITRHSVYNIIKDKLNASGLNGEICILKLICEVNSSMLGKNNGVIGSIIHILLSPSTSFKENISSKMYKAEKNGLNANCQQYEIGCKASMVDIISATAESISKGAKRHSNK